VGVGGMYQNTGYAVVFEQLYTVSPLMKKTSTSAAATAATVAAKQLGRSLAVSTYQPTYPPTHLPRRVRSTSPGSAA
jgi:hypothetical protein